MNGKKNLLAVLILITAIVALFLGIDAQKTKDRKEKATKVVVDEGVCRPEGFKNRWLQTIGKNINIEKNAEEQGKLILRAKEKVLRFRSQISVLCTNGSQEEVCKALEEVKDCLVGVNTGTCRSLLVDLERDLVRNNPIARYSKLEKPDSQWFAAVSNLFKMVDFSSDALWFYGGDCLVASALDSWSLNVLYWLRQDFQKREWFDSSEVLRQIFEERVASCYDSESSHIKIACKEYDLEKDYVDPRIEGRCSMFNNCEIMAFLKLLERPPAWAKADLPRLKNAKDIHPILKGWWLSSGD